MRKSDTYIFDINKICDFVFGGDDKRNSDVEITESYEYVEDAEGQMVLQPVAKSVTEVKSKDQTNQNTIRYDMIRMFIDILDGIQDEAIMTAGEKMTFNTLEAYGLIKDINTDSTDE